MSVYSNATYRFLGQIDQAKSLEALEAIGKEINAKQAENDERDLAAASAPDKAGPAHLLETPAHEVLTMDVLKRAYRDKLNRFREIPVSGTSFRQDHVRLCAEGDLLEMHLDPLGTLLRKLDLKETRGHTDPDAVLLTRKGGRLPVGYIPKFAEDKVTPLAARFAAAIREQPGRIWVAKVAAVVGGQSRNKPTIGLRILLPSLAAPAAPAPGANASVT